MSDPLLSSADSRGTPVSAWFPLPEPATIKTKKNLHRPPGLAN
jgi:hypothetical protein